MGLRADKELSMWQQMTQRRIIPLRGDPRSEFRRLREQAGLTLDEARALLEVSERTIYRYENGECAPTKLAIRTLQAAIGERRVYGGRKEPETRFRFIDLFAGIGGLRLGFESIGGHCVFTSEWDANAQKTYALNFPDNHPIGGDSKTNSLGSARSFVNDAQFIQSRYC